MLRRTILAFVAGLVLSLAYEPVAIAYVMPLALAAFALCTRGLRARSGWMPGLAFGMGFYFVHIYWMKSSIGADAWIGLSLIEAVFYGVLGSVAALLHRAPAWPAWLAAAWTTMEITRSGWPFSGMPWGRLGFGVVDTPVAPLLAYVGVNGVSFLVAGLGFLLAQVIISDERLAAAAGAVTVAAVMVLPTFVPWTLDTTAQTTVAAVQGNVPGRGNDVLEDYRGLTRNHVDATTGLAEDVAAGREPQPDFVLWPENSTAVDPFSDDLTHAEIDQAVASIGVPIVVGAIVDSGADNILNQGVVWDPATGPGDRYTKQNPVPYGEYIPFRDSLSGFLSSRVERVPRDMLSGTRATPLRVAGVDLADSICFDIAYDGGLATQIDNGAQLLTVQTSNASFIFTDQIDQQFAITRARAIETGRYVVVASTNGVSGVIAPDGSVVARTEARTQDVLVETVDLKDGVTPGIAVGATFVWLSPALTLVGLVLGMLAYRRRRGDTGPDVRPAMRPA